MDLIRPEAITCVNIHDGISTHNFPTVIPLIFAFSQVSGFPNEFSYQFKIQDRKGKVIAESPISAVKPLPNVNMTHKLISAFSGLTFEDEGTYDILLELDNYKVANLPFRVVKISEEQQGAIA